GFRIIVRKSGRPDLRWGRSRSFGRGGRLIGWTPTPNSSPQGGGEFRRSASVVALDAENAHEFRPGLAQLGVVAVGRLGNLAEAGRRRFARAMRGGESGAAVARIVGRRLQAGLRADAGLAAIDRGIEQVGERRRDRLRVGPRRLGARRPRRIARLLRFVGGLRHRRNMGGTIRRRKGQTGSGSEAAEPRNLPTRREL